MGLDNALDYRQAQPSTTLLALPYLPKAVEQMRHVHGGDTEARVRDPEQRLAVSRRRSDCDAPPCPRELEGVADQVLENLDEPVWEALMLVERGRLVVESDATKWVEDMVGALPRREAPITHQVAVESQRVSLSHQDPADRFLAATAIVYELTLVTSDERLLKSPDFAVLANR